MWPLPPETIGQTRPQRKANRTSTSSTTKRYGKGARPLSPLVQEPDFGTETLPSCELQTEDLQKSTTSSLLEPSF